jgi:hypothetical protein
MHNERELVVFVVLVVSSGVWCPLPPLLVCTAVQSLVSVQHVPAVGHVLYSMTHLSRKTLLCPETTLCCLHMC